MCLYNCCICFKNDYVLFVFHYILHKPSFTLGNNKVNTDLECLCVCFMLLTWPVTYRPAINGRLKQGREKNNLITATYPQAEGLQVHAARSETEMEKEREGGVITAQTSYSTTLTAPIKITLRAITGYRLGCYCTAAFDSDGGFTVCQHYSPYLNNTHVSSTFPE